MITPSFGLTATERVLPKLALDFTTASLDPRVTFTRTGNTATVVNSSGFVEPINADLPRFDFDPVTLVCKGLLIEEARTNALVYSSDFQQSPSWSTVNKVAVVANVITSPDGSSNADKLNETTAIGAHWLLQLYTRTAGATPYTFSFFAKKGERQYTWVQLGDGGGNGGRCVFDLDSGTISTPAYIGGAGGWTSPSATITNMNNGWYRCTLTATPAAAGTNTRLDIGISETNTWAESYAGTTGYGFYIYGAQFELGAFATSYIPTTTTALTRNADVASMTGTNFSDWYNASEGTILSMGQLNGLNTANAPRIGLNVSNGATTERIHNFVSSATQITSRVISSGANQAVLANTVSTLPAAFVKTAVAYKVDNFGASSNSSTVATDASGVVPTVDRAYIGSSEVDGTSSYMNGTVQKIMYWPQRLTNAELQAFTK